MSPLAHGGGLLRMTTGGGGLLVGVLAKASLGLQPGNIQNFRGHFFFFALMQAYLGALIDGSITLVPAFHASMYA